MGTKPDMTVRIDADQAESLSEIAAAEGRTVHDVVADAIEAHTRNVREALNLARRHVSS